MEKVTRGLINDSSYDSVLRSAMVTEETNDGSRVGEWEIVLKEEGKRKYYDVVSVNTGTYIATDLTLYEAAYGIARSLADGQPITSKIIREVLQAEGEYARSLNDAIFHKHSLSKPLNTNRKAILEDRYDVAKERARLARDKVKDLVKPLPF